MANCNIKSEASFNQCKSRLMKSYNKYTLKLALFRRVIQSVYKISSTAYRTLRAKSLWFTVENLTLVFNGRIPEWRLFKILKFKEPSLLSMTSSTLYPHLLPGGLLWQMVIVISFPHERRNCTEWICSWNKRLE